MIVETDKEPITEVANYDDWSVCDGSLQPDEPGGFWHTISGKVFPSMRMRLPETDTGIYDYDLAPGYLQREADVGIKLFQATTPGAIPLSFSGKDAYLWKTYQEWFWERLPRYRREMVTAPGPSETAERQTYYRMNLSVRDLCEGGVLNREVLETLTEFHLQDYRLIVWLNHRQLALDRSGEGNGPVVGMYLMGWTADTAKLCELEPEDPSAGMVYPSVVAESFNQIAHQNPRAALRGQEAAIMLLPPIGFLGAPLDQEWASQATNEELTQALSPERQAQFLAKFFNLLHLSEAQFTGDESDAEAEVDCRRGLVTLGPERTFLIAQSHGGATAYYLGQMVPELTITLVNPALMPPEREDDVVSQKIFSLLGGFLSSRGGELEQLVKNFRGLGALTKKATVGLMTDLMAQDLRKRTPEKSLFRLVMPHIKQIHQEVVAGTDLRVVGASFASMVIGVREAAQNMVNPPAIIDAAGDWLTSPKANERYLREGIKSYLAKMREAARVTIPSLDDIFEHFRVLTFAQGGHYIFLDPKSLPEVIGKSLRFYYARRHWPDLEEFLQPFAESGKLRFAKDGLSAFNSPQEFNAVIGIQRNWQILGDVMELLSLLNRKVDAQQELNLTIGDLQAIEYRSSQLESKSEEDTEDCFGYWAALYAFDHSRAFSHDYVDYAEEPIDSQAIIDFLKRLETGEITLSGAEETRKFIDKIRYLVCDTINLEGRKFKDEQEGERKKSKAIRDFQEIKASPALEPLLGFFQDYAQEGLVLGDLTLDLVHFHLYLHQLSDKMPGRSEQRKKQTI